MGDFFRAAQIRARAVSDDASGVRALMGGRSVSVPAPRARAGDRSTSHRAAAVARFGAETMSARVLRAVWDAGDGGMTDEEISALLGVAGSSARGRRADLVRLGLIEPAGEQRALASGLFGVVWRVTPAGGATARRLAG